MSSQKARAEAMTNLLYVGVPIAVGLVAALLSLAIGRRPQSMEHGMKEFSRELGAIAPERSPSRRRETDKEARRG